MRKTILIFGLLSIGVLSLFELSKFSIMSGSNSGEMLLIFAGVAFIAIGFMISKLFVQKKSLQNAPHVQIESGLSKQELNVLKLINEGLSNQEIGQHLFISESTVKSHVHHIFVKLKAKRRTEAVKIGRALNII